MASREGDRHVVHKGAARSLTPSLSSCSRAARALSSRQGSLLGASALKSTQNRSLSSGGGLRNNPTGLGLGLCSAALLALPRAGLPPLLSTLQ